MLPSVSFVFAHDARGRLFDNVVRMSPDFWAEPQFWLKSNTDLLLKAFYFPVRERLGVDHCATREAAAFLREQIAVFKNGSATVQPCVYCTLQGAALQQAEAELPKAYLQPHRQGFHCGDAQHAERLHALCKLDANMRWNCCAAGPEPPAATAPPATEQ